MSEPSFEDRMFGLTRALLTDQEHADLYAWAGYIFNLQRAAAAKALRRMRLIDRKLAREYWEMLREMRRMKEVAERKRIFGA